MTGLPGALPQARAGCRERDAGGCGRLSVGLTEERAALEDSSVAGRSDGALQGPRRDRLMFASERAVVHMLGSALAARPLSSGRRRDAWGSLRG